MLAAIIYYHPHLRVLGQWVKMLHPAIGAWNPGCMVPSPFVLPLYISTCRYGLMSANMHSAFGYIENTGSLFLLFPMLAASIHYHLHIIVNGCKYCTQYWVHETGCMVPAPFLLPSYTGELGYDGLIGTRQIGPSYAKSVIYIWQILDMHWTGTKHIVRHMQKSVVQWSVISKFTCITTGI